MEFNREGNRTQTFQLTNINPYKTDDHGNTPLHIAASKGDLNQIRTLIKIVPNASDIIEKKNKYGSTSLHYATWFGQLLSVTYLVECGADLKTKDNYDQTLLHAAAWNGHLKLVTFFFESGLAAFLEDKDQRGNTPLLSAAQNGHLKVVKWLISVGAEIYAKDHEGNTLLFLAVEKGELDIIEYLVREKQIDLSVFKDTEESKNNTLLHLAALRNRVSPGKVDIRLPQYLVEQGADIEARNSHGDTPLHLAVENADINLIQYLIEQGANREAKNDDGNTPLQLARENDDDDLVDYLIKKGANTKGDHGPDQSLFKQGANIEYISNEGNIRIHEVYQERPEELGHYILKQKGVLLEDNRWSDNLLEANPSQATKVQRRKKTRHRAPKSQAVTLNNPFDMVGINDSLPSLGKASGFFGYNSSGAEASSPLSSISERVLTDNLETSNSNVSEAFFLASTLFNKPRKKHSATPVDENKRLQQTQIIEAIEQPPPFPSNMTTKPF